MYNRLLILCGRSLVGVASLTEFAYLGFGEVTTNHLTACTSGVIIFVERSIGMPKVYPPA